MTNFGYDFSRDNLAALLIARFYPEKTDRETPIIRDFLKAHGIEFDRFSFSVRVGQGVTPDPAHLEQIQANTSRFTRKRIDMIVWRGAQPWLIEVKERITPAVLGQLQTYRQLWLEDNPDAQDPRLVAIGRFSDDDTLRVLAAHGVDVFLYEAAAG